MLFQCRVIAPDNIGRFLADRLDAAASQDVFTLRVEAIGTAGNGPHLVNQTRSAIAIEKRTNGWPRRGGRIPNAALHQLGGAARQGVDGGRNRLPLFPSDARRGG